MRFQIIPLDTYPLIYRTYMYNKYYWCSMVEQCKHTVATNLKANYGDLYIHLTWQINETHATNSHHEIGTQNLQSLTCYKLTNMHICFTMSVTNGPVGSKNETFTYAANIADNAAKPTTCGSGIFLQHERYAPWRSWEWHDWIQWLHGLRQARAQSIMWC